MTADEIRQAAEDRLREVDAQLAALAEEKRHLQRMLGAQLAPPPAPTWEVPRVPLPGEQRPYVEPGVIPWGVPGVYVSGGVTWREVGYTIDGRVFDGVREPRFATS
jgi:hypothetical protein